MSSPMLKLHEYMDEIDRVLDWIAENEEQVIEAGGELPPELWELLDRIEGDFTEKVRRVALVILNLSASAKAAQAEAERLSRMGRSYQRQAESLKRYLLIQLERAGKARVETPSVKVRIQKNTRPSIRCVSAEIPERFQRVTVELDTAAAYAALKAEGCLPEEPGLVQVDGLVVELGRHVRVW